MKAKALAPLMLVLWLAAALGAGCATVEPEQFAALQSQVTRQHRQIAQLEQKIDALDKQIAEGRKPQADLVSQVASLRQDMMRVSGRVEESEHNLGQAINQRNSQEAQMAKESAAKAQAQTDERLKRLEAYLGMASGKAGEKAEAKAPPGKAAAQQPPAEPKPKDIYDLGIRLYKQKSYGPARDRFAEYIKKYPKSSLADNAQYWVGECFYAEKKYEEAILAYNQMIKHYPKSAQVPAALYKQGLSFRALGDKRTAKIVLGKLVKDYPKSSQAKLAQKVLKKL
ncbi:MAG: tol-pal system protein YbgF [Proteobacteria bacterium]|nr:tol-pal system protein YbgF [Pseudomonadota bacterium]MBU4277846.1 tol-pal system protein YbgF [Pseudomonadota bacterium]MBU4385252.1 tol-pal system protein YbgF [Pseudomonadota bacterium]MCG2764860.1 tol-pal system protein YbgF [Desulfarculaceae bacterium]